MTILTTRRQRRLQQSPCGRCRPRIQPTRASSPVPYTGIQFVGIPEFQSFGTVVGQNISGALSGKMSVDQALKDSQAAVARAVKQAGYPKN